MPLLNSDGPENELLPRLYVWRPLFFKKYYPVENSKKQRIDTTDLNILVWFICFTRQLLQCSILKFQNKQTQKQMIQIYVSYQSCLSKT